MAYKRKRSTTATTGRRVRRRTARPSRNLRMVGSPTFFVKQKTFFQTITFSSASIAGYWRYWSTTPSNMSNFGQHATVFDEYKIVGVTFEFRPQWDNFSPDNSLWSSGVIHTIVDPSSSTIPAGAFGTGSLNAFLEQGNVKSQRFGTNVVRYFKPKVSTQVSGGGLSGRLIPAPWCKTDDVAVQHNGMHVYLQQFDSTLLPMKYDVFVTHHIMFRGHR